MKDISALISYSLCMRLVGLIGRVDAVVFKKSILNLGQGVVFENGRNRTREEGRFLAIEEVV